MTTWKDETSYRQGERGTIEPRIWEARAGDLRVTVTRHRDYPGDWVVRCYSIGIDLQRLNVVGDALPEVAQAKALQVVRRRLIGLMDDLAIIQPATTTPTPPQQ